MRPSGTGGCCRADASGVRSARSTSTLTESTSGPADRCGANSCAGSDVNPIVKLDPDGKVVQSFGAGQISGPTAWTSTARGTSGSRMRAPPTAGGTQAISQRRWQGSHRHQVQPAGQSAAWSSARPAQTGNPPTHFTEPNDVLVAPDGSIFVAEAHNDQFLDAPGTGGIGRISKFAPDGKFIKSWGTWGYGPGQFRGAHSLAMDSRGRLFVADRGNRRIQIFDQQGAHIDTWYQFSRISGLFIDAKDVLYAIDSESDDAYNPGWRKGLRVGNARTGEVWYFVPEHVSKQASGMGGYGSMGEGVAADAQGNVIAGEVGPVQGLTKFIPRLKR